MEAIKRIAGDIAKHLGLCLGKDRVGRMQPFLFFDRTVVRERRRRGLGPVKRLFVLIAWVEHGSLIDTCPVLRK